jgi:hypothetical protein
MNARVTPRHYRPSINPSRTKLHKVCIICTCKYHFRGAPKNALLVVRGTTAFPRPVLRPASEQGRPVKELQVMMGEGAPHRSQLPALACRLPGKLHRSSDVMDLDPRRKNFLLLLQHQPRQASHIF